MPFTTMIIVADDDVRFCLCSAFEGGSNYWIESAEHGSANGSPCPKLAPGSAEEWPMYLVAPFCPGHWVEVTSNDPPGELASGKQAPYRLDREAIGVGLMLMATKYPTQYAQLLSGDGDANTGDLLLQLALFGEEVYA